MGVRVWRMIACACACVRVCGRVCVRVSVCASGCGVVHGCVGTQVRTCERALTRCAEGSRSSAGPAAPQAGRCIGAYCVERAAILERLALRRGLDRPVAEQHRRAEPQREQPATPIRQCLLRGIPCRTGFRVAWDIVPQQEHSASSARMRWSLRAETAACARRLAAACVSARLRISAGARVCVCGVCAVCVVPHSHCAARADQSFVSAPAADAAAAHSRSCSRHRAHVACRVPRGDRWLHVA